MNRPRLAYRRRTGPASAAAPAPTPGRCCWPPPSSRPSRCSPARCRRCCAPPPTTPSGTRSAEPATTPTSGPRPHGNATTGRTAAASAHPRLAEDVDDFRDRATDELGPGLHAVLHPPVATVISPTLKSPTAACCVPSSSPTWPRDGGGPDVTWIAGGPPRPAVPRPTDVEVPYDGPPWPVQVGLSEADAAALGLRPGDPHPAQGRARGMSRTSRSAASSGPGQRRPRLAARPALLSPVAGADGMGTTRLAGLLSRDSLPDARLAFAPGRAAAHRLVHAPTRTPLTWAIASSRSPRPWSRSRPPPAPPAPGTAR